MHDREPRRQHPGPAPRPGAAAPVHRSGPHGILDLQRLAGNTTTVRAMRSGSGPATSTPVQRAPVMGVDEFRGKTSAKTLRVGLIAHVDRALKAFHALKNPSQEQQLNALTDIVEACKAYLDRKAEGHRREGVEELRDQGYRERAGLALGPPLEISSQGAQRLRDVLAAIDHGLGVIRRHEWATSAYYDRNLPETAREEAQRLDSAAFQTMMRGYIDDLRALLDDPSLPEQTREVIQEVTAATELVTTLQTPQGAAGGTNAHPPTAGGPLADTRYTINVDVGTHSFGGTPTLLGHLAHEATHVSAHQSFGGSVVMPLAPATATLAEIAELARQRTQTLNELEGLMERDPSFHDDQRFMLKQQIDYGKQPGKLGLYAANFNEPSKITGHKKITDGERDTLLQWEEAAGGNSGTLIEYDTVLNQMLIYLHMWKIPLDNPFYVRLRAAAAEATARRAQARAAQARAAQARAAQARAAQDEGAGPSGAA